MAIRFYKPALYRKDMDAVLQTMVDEKIGPGERKKEFLKSFASYSGKKDGIALRSYPDVISSSLEALELNEGDSVIVSVLSPRIYLDILKRLGLKAIIIDTDENGLPSVEDAARHLDENPKAFLYYEPICQIPDSSEAIKELGLPVIEDISQSFGSSFSDVKESSTEDDVQKEESNVIHAGSCGDIVISEFEENGVISTGGGAAAVTSDDALAEKLRKSVAALSPYIDLPDMNAALGIVQLSKAEVLLERRFSIYRTFMQAQQKSGTKLFGSSSPFFRANGYSFSVIVETKPDEAIAFSQKHGVSSKRTFTSSIGARYQDRYDRFPNAISAITRAISFPLYPFLSKNEIESIQRVISHLG